MFHRFWTNKAYQRKYSAITPQLAHLIYHEFYDLLTMVYKCFGIYLLCFAVFLEYLQDHECFGDMW